jgi:branched-chain amino acid transport system permease protein
LAELATFIQQVINGLMLGGGYALVAIGYTLIFGVLNLLHLAHGEVAMIGSYVGLTLVLIAMSQVGVLPLWIVLVAAMIGAGVVGIVVELVAFRPLGRRQLHITPLITTIAVAFVLQEAAVKLFGSEQRSFPVAMFDELKKYDLQLGAFRITYVQMFIIAASLVLMVGLYFFVEKTTMGQAMRACAENTQTARLLGVNVHWITIWTFGIASALAGAAGVLIGLAYNITPLMGGALGLKGLTIMLFGGSGNIVGAMVAALILGMIETMSVAYLVPAWKDGFAFGILILILLYKPTGLFGSRLQIEAGR